MAQNGPTVSITNKNLPNQLTQFATLEIEKQNSHIT
jgi:hypothetical protein